MSSDSDEAEQDVFYFESDHLALRGNPDYSRVLRLIAKLNAQRCRVHHQMEQLIFAKNHYMNDPEAALKKLSNNEPIIDETYLTRLKVPEIDAYSLLAKYDVKPKKDVDQSANQPKVRGRIVDETKSETFNQLWTEREQRRLDELLIKYPAEEVEMRRFAKIAMELGNRTPLQVASRVQKYFQKLHEAGMPIPGRIPKNRRGGLTTRLKAPYRSTTFFPGYNVRVNSEEYDFLSPNFESIDSPDSVDTNAPPTNDTDSIGALDRFDAQERKLFMLKTIRDEKTQHNEGYTPDLIATKCEKCNYNPLSKTRWYCQTCYCFIKMCSDCLVAQLLADDFEHISHDVIVNNEQ